METGSGSQMPNEPRKGAAQNLREEAQLELFDFSRTLYDQAVVRANIFHQKIILAQESEELTPGEAEELRTWYLLVLRSIFHGFDEEAL